MEVQLDNDNVHVWNNVLIIPPEQNSYPVGTYAIAVGSRSEDFPSQSLSQAFSKIFKFFTRIRATGALWDNSALHRGSSGTQLDDLYATSSDDEQPVAQNKLENLLFHHVLQCVQKANQLMSSKKSNIKFETHVKRHGKLVFVLEVMDFLLPWCERHQVPLDRACRAWGIEMDQFLIMELHLFAEGPKDVRFSEDMQVRQKLPFIYQNVHGKCKHDTQGNLFLLSWFLSHFVYYDSMHAFESVQALECEKKSDNFIMYLLHSLRRAMCSCMLHCLVCVKHLYENDTQATNIFLKPSICENAACRKIFYEGSIGKYQPSIVHQAPLARQVEDFIVQHELLVDFLIGTIAATMGAGQQVELFKFPHFMLKQEEKAGHQSLVRNMIAKLPPVSKLVEWNKDFKLRERLDKLDPRFYPLLTWIINVPRLLFIICERCDTPTSTTSIVYELHHYLHSSMHLLQKTLSPSNREFSITLDPDQFHHAFCHGIFNIAKKQSAQNGLQLSKNVKPQIVKLWEQSVCTQFSLRCTINASEDSAILTRMQDQQDCFLLHEESHVSHYSLYITRGQHKVIPE